MSVGHRDNGCVLHSLLWKMVPDDLESLDRMLVRFTILVGEYCEHAGLV